MEAEEQAKKSTPEATEGAKGESEASAVPFAAATCPSDSTHVSPSTRHSNHRRHAILVLKDLRQKLS